MKIEGVCTYRKPSSDISPVGEIDKWRVQGKIYLETKADIEVWGFEGMFFVPASFS